MTDFLARNEHGYLLLGFGPGVEHRLDHDQDTPLNASFVVVDRAGSVLLVFDNWRRHWELPGGGREPGESPRTAAVRELFEETGLWTEKLIFVGVSSYQSPPDSRHERVAVYRTTLPDDAPDPVPVFQAGQEIGAVRWWDPRSSADGVDALDRVIIDRVINDRVATDAPSEVTRNSYQAAADRYAEQTHPVSADTRAPFLDRVAELLPGGRLLEVGSGPGWDADYLEQRGLSVQRSDITPAFVDMIRAAGHDARVLDVRTGDLGGGWDAVLADAVLLHLNRTEFAAVAGRVAAAVRPGGLFAFTLKEGDGEAWSEAKLDLPRWFVYWREPEVRAVLEA
ncbi:MAG: NUDIX domain-containing protein, partial [Microlunatus sp.]|nr:NUDIX domain-containing protein [Microlunatus sp.]